MSFEAWDKIFVGILVYIFGFIGASVIWGGISWFTVTFLLNPYFDVPLLSATQYFVLGAIIVIILNVLKS